MPGGGGYFERANGDPAFPVSLGIKARKMASDDLCGLVTLDPPRPLVPGNDVPGGIEHEYCVIR